MWLGKSNKLDVSAMHKQINIRASFCIFGLSKGIESGKICPSFPIYLTIHRLVIIPQVKELA